MRCWWCYCPRVSWLKMSVDRVRRKHGPCRPSPELSELADDDDGPPKGKSPCISPIGSPFCLALSYVVSSSSSVRSLICYGLSGLVPSLLPTANPATREDDCTLDLRTLQEAHRLLGRRLRHASSAATQVPVPWLDGWMDGWVGGWMDGWMDGWMGGWMDGWMNGWVGGWMDGWAGGWMGEWMDGWMDG
jgi:hypothetical protein